MSDNSPPADPAHELDRVVIRVAGDSGDGMQLTGDRFTSASAVLGNDLATLPDFPAEIRAPQGTLAGVSAFQVHISDHDITTPGDAADVLVAMNPAALKANLGNVRRAATILVNTDSFGERDLKKAGYVESPLTDGTLEGFTVYEIPMTELTVKAVEPTGAKPRDAQRSKNFFALGVLSWMYTRPVEPTLEWIEAKFGKHPTVAEANRLAFKAGFHFGETAELIEHRYEVQPAPLEPGTYTNVTGNTALAWGLIAAAQQSGLELFLGSYPITPASDILHELSKHKHFGVRTLQAEDEIAGVGAALGAAFGGSLAVTTTSGPGIALKSETVSLAVSLELPLLVVDIQRGGPSTGLPTKTEAADLLLAMYGRHSESPLPILAPYSPAHCFHVAIEAARIAITYRTPVMLLSDGYLANGAEPWRLPDVATLPVIDPDLATGFNDGERFLPYRRDPETLARPWAVPGTPGLAHRIGGLEKEDETGNVSYDPVNHERMIRLRADKVGRVAASIPPVEVQGDADADVLVLGWGSTWGAITGAVRRMRAQGHKVAHAHLVHLHPFPSDLGEVLGRYGRVLVPEMNLGQLSRLVRAEFLVDARSITKVQGLPFTAAELEAEIKEALNE